MGVFLAHAIDRNFASATDDSSLPIGRLAAEVKSSADALLNFQIHLQVAC